MADELHLDITAAEALAITNAGVRRRQGHCVTIMQHTMAAIRKAAQAGQQSHVVEGVGQDVDLNTFIDELKMLGYTVTPAGGNRVARSLEITW